MRELESFQIYGENSIAFGGAPRREADSQPISQLARPAVSEIEAHSLGFLSVANSAPSNGEDSHHQNKQWPNSNAADLLGRWFEPHLANHGSGAFNHRRPAGIRSADPKFCSRLCYHLTAVCPDSNMSPLCLKPSHRKLLTPPPQKSDIQF